MGRGQESGYGVLVDKEIENRCWGRRVFGFFSYLHRKKGSGAGAQEKRPR